MTINEAINKTWNNESEMLALPSLINDEFKGAEFLGKGASRVVFDIGGDKVLRVSNLFNDTMFDEAESKAISDFNKSDGSIIEVYSVGSTELDGGTVYWSIAEKVEPVDSNSKESAALDKIAKEIESVIGTNAVKTMLEDRGEADAITLLWVYRNTDHYSAIKEAVTDKDRLNKLIKYLDNLAKLYGKYYEDINARNTSLRKNGEYTMHDL